MVGGYGPGVSHHTLEGVVTDDKPTHRVDLKANAGVSAHGPSVIVTSGDDPSWQEKWLIIQHHLSTIDAAYAGTAPGGNIGLKGAILAFFTNCYHLWEWLVNDPTTSVTEAAIDALLASSIPLQQCEAICNSDKHHTRNRGRTARIRTTTGSTTGQSADVEVDWLSPTAVTVDAHTLAEQCVVDWRAFFPTVGLTEP